MLHHSMMEKEGGEENKEREGGERRSDGMREAAWIHVWDCADEEHY